MSYTSGFAGDVTFAPFLRVVIDKYVITETTATIPTKYCSMINVSKQVSSAGTKYAQ